MYSLLINLYELGQFLRIFLWITLPAAVVAMLVSTYFHYRRKRGGREGMVLAVSGFGNGYRGTLELVRQNRMEDFSAGGDAKGNEIGEVNENLGGDEGREVNGNGEENEEIDPNEKIYRGILWMKDKYEQYRDLADRRYEQVKEELARAEKRYQDLLVSREEHKIEGERITEVTDSEAGTDREDHEDGIVWTGSEADKEAMREIIKEKNRQIHFLQDQLDQRIKNYHELEYQGRENKNRLDENKNRLEELEDQLTAAQRSLEERQIKIGEMGVLLMNIYKELDQSLHLERPAGLV